MPFILLAIALSVSTAVDQRRQTLAEMEETARTLQRAIDREIELAEVVLRSLSLSRSITEAIAAGPEGPAEARRAFHAMSSAVAADDRHIIHNISLHDRATGRQITNTLLPVDEPLPSLAEVRLPEPRGGDDPQALVRAVFEHIVNERRLFVSDLYFGPVAGGLIVSVMLPVERDGEVVAVLSANMLPASLGQVLRANTPAIGYVASVVDRDAIIVARTGEEERFVGARATEEVRAFQANPSSSLQTRESLTADGARVYGVFRRLSTAPWAIAYGAPMAVVDAPIRRLLLIMGGAGSLALGFFVMASSWQAGRLAREMGALARDAERIGRGAPLPLHVDRVREVAEVRAALRSGVASLAAAEERMRLAVEGSGLAAWDLDVASNQVRWTGHFLEMLGLPDQAPPLPLRAWLDRVHPEDRAAVRAAWEAAARDGSRFHAVFRILRADDGSERWLETLGSHIDVQGHHRFIGVTFDVSDRHAAEEQRLLLMREVDHRAKNVLAVVHSVVRLTRASDPADYAAAVEGRVRALAQAHDLLARDRWAGAALGAIAGVDLAAAIANGQVTLDGPEVRLSADAVQPLSMVLHELATNATKYGALSVPEGRVRLSWRHDPEAGFLRLAWVERGGPPAKEPEERGFGSRLIAVTVAGQLGGEVRWTWAEEGLSVEIAIAADRVVVAAPAATAPATAPVAGGPLPHPEATNLAGRRILVIEDETLIGTEFTLALSRAGAVPLGPAASPAAARSILAEARRIDAAVLDVNLAGESSLPLARALAAERVPIVVVTGYTELPAGWDEIVAIATVLRKPIDPETLLAALREALGRRRRAA